MNILTMAEAICATVADKVPGLRTYAWPADTVQPPALVVRPPAGDFQSLDGGLCGWGPWDFPITLTVARGTDHQAAVDLYRYVDEVIDALMVDLTLGGAAHTSQTIAATPAPPEDTPVGQLPAYTITLRVFA